MDRARGQNRGGYREPCRTLENHATELCKDAPVRLTFRQSKIVLRAIQQVCEFRDWDLVAAHVRTNHVHVVVSGIAQPNRAISAFKAYASRALNDADGYRKNRWSREGSTRPLRTPHATGAATRYVIDGQGAPIAVYAGGRERSPDSRPEL